jgi:hypothetical protein
MANSAGAVLYCCVPVRGVPLITKMSVSRANTANINAPPLHFIDAGCQSSNRADEFFLQILTATQIKRVIGHQLSCCLLADYLAS